MRVGLREALVSVLEIAPWSVGMWPLRLGYPLSLGGSRFALPVGEKRRGKSPPAHLEEPRDQMDHQGLPLMAETTGGCSAPCCPQWGTAGVPAGETKMLGGK